MAKLRRIKPGSVQKTFSNVWYTELWRPQLAMAPQLDWSNSKRHFWGYQSRPNLKQIWSVVPESLDRLQPFRIYFLPLVSCHLNQGIFFIFSFVIKPHSPWPHCQCPVQISDDNAKGIGLVTAHSQTFESEKFWVNQPLKKAWGPVVRMPCSGDRINQQNHQLMWGPAKLDSIVGPRDSIQLPEADGNRLGKLHLVFQEANPLTKQRPRKHSLRLRSWAYLHHPPRDLDI